MNSRKWFESLQGQKAEIFGLPFYVSHVNSGRNRFTLTLDQVEARRLHDETQAKKTVSPTQEKTAEISTREASPRSPES